MQESPQQAIERYLRSGEHDAHFRPWPGDNYVACARYGGVALRQALISAVRHRKAHAELPAAIPELDVEAFTRGKVAPMVRGLFPVHEHESVLDVLGRSVVFLTPATIDMVLEQTPWLSTAWDLANLYLAGVGAELLADDAPKLLGLSEGTTCYLSAEYFDAPGRFNDFLVHEAAHIFHNCKRRTIGLRETRRRECDCARPTGVSGCWRSSSPSAKPSLMPARPIAAFTIEARDCGSGRHCSRNTRRGRCRRTTGWMWTNTSISCAKRLSPATAGNASWQGARRPRMGHSQVWKWRPSWPLRRFDAVPAISQPRRLRKATTRWEMSMVTSWPSL